MEEFNAWFEAHRLDRFYVDGFFVLDNVEKLERELGLASTSTPSRGS
jgi:endonuclease/exonuclease/phosphatase family metal-dependent hydrolase